MTPLDDLAYNVVFEAFRNLDFIKLAGRDLFVTGIVDQDTAIDVRRLGLHPSLKKKIRFLAAAFEQDFDMTSDHTAQLRGGNFRLRFHEAVAAPAGRRSRDLFIEIESPGPLFVGI